MFWERVASGKPFPKNMERETASIAIPRNGEKSVLRKCEKKIWKNTIGWKESAKDGGTWIVA